jgi:hypothetical protein
VVDIMNGQESTSAGPARDAEAPTTGAELHINLVGADTGRLPAGSGRRSTKDRDDVSLLQHRIHAAVEAETAKVPEVTADRIDQELARIMLALPGESSPGRKRRSPLTAFSASRGGSGTGSSPEAVLVSAGPPRADDQEPTAAAVLRIRLVPG